MRVAGVSRSPAAGAYVYNILYFTQKKQTQNYFFRWGVLGLEGTRPIILYMAGIRPLTNDLCGQYFKVKVKINDNAVFDVDFNVLTALKGWVGHAPKGRGALHISILAT
jgi:hypothetical protein